MKTMKKLMIFLGCGFFVCLLASCPGFGQKLVRLPDVTFVNESSIDIGIRFRIDFRGFYYGSVYTKYIDAIENIDENARVSSLQCIDTIKPGSEVVVDGRSIIALPGLGFPFFFLIQLDETFVYGLTIAAFVSPSIRFSFTDELLQQIKKADPVDFPVEWEEYCSQSRSRYPCAVLKLFGKKDLHKNSLWDFSFAEPRICMGFLFEPPAVGETPLFFVKGGELFSVGEGDPIPKKIDLQP